MPTVDRSMCIVELSLFVDVAVSMMPIIPDVDDELTFMMPIVGRRMCIVELRLFFVVAPTFRFELFLGGGLFVRYLLHSVDVAVSMMPIYDAADVPINMMPTVDRSMCIVELSLFVDVAVSMMPIIPDVDDELTFMMPIVGRRMCIVELR